SSIRIRSASRKRTVIVPPDRANGLDFAPIVTRTASPSTATEIISVTDSFRSTPGITPPAIRLVRIQRRSALNRDPRSHQSAPASTRCTQVPSSSCQADSGVKGRQFGSRSIVPSLSNPSVECHFESGPRDEGIFDERQLLQDLPLRLASEGHGTGPDQAEQD